MLNLDQRNRRQFFTGIGALALIAGTWSAGVGAEGTRLPPTEETDIGIYYTPGAPELRNLWQNGDPGEKLLLRGRVLTTAGALKSWPSNTE